MSLYGSPSQPDFAAALATIQGWDKDRLQELLNDEEKFDSLIKGLSQIKSLHDEKEMLMASNRSLAEYNLSQEPVLKDLKTQLADKHREAMRTAEKVKNAKRELDEKSGSVEPDTLLALLQVSPDRYNCPYWGKFTSDSIFLETVSRCFFADCPCRGRGGQ